MHDMKKMSITRKVRYSAKQATKINAWEDAECVVFMGLKS